MTVYIIAIVVLLLFSALMSCGETSIVAVSRARISRMAEEGDKRAKKLEKMLKKECKVGEIIHSKIGPVIGAHSGKGTLLINFYGKQRG